MPMPKTKSSCGTRTVDVHLDRYRSAGAEGDQLVAAVIGEGDAGENHFAGAPALLPRSGSSPAALRRSSSIGRGGATLCRRHGLQIGIDDAHRIADRFRLAVIEPERAVAEVAHLVELVRDEDQRHAAVLHLLNLGHALRGELLVADGKHLIDQQHVGIDVDGDGEAEADVHAGGVRFDRLIDEIGDAGERDDLVEARVDLLARKAEHDAVDVDVLAAGDLGMKAGAELDQRGHAAVHGARCRWSA